MPEETRGAIHLETEILHLIVEEIRSQEGLVHLIVDQEEEIRPIHLTVVREEIRHAEIRRMTTATDQAEEEEIQVLPETHPEVQEEVAEVIIHLVGDLLRVSEMLSTEFICPQLCQGSAERVQRLDCSMIS